MLAMFLAALDQTIVATALPTMGREFGDVTTSVLDRHDLSSRLDRRDAALRQARRHPWATGGAALRHRRLRGRLGRLRALSPTPWLLIASRFIQGLGGGGLIALAQTIVADMVSPKERGRYRVYFASVFLTSSLLGPVLGGFISGRLRLVGDLLDQPAARARSLLDDQLGAEAPAAP